LNNKTSSASSTITVGPQMPPFSSGVSGAFSGSTMLDLGSGRTSMVRNNEEDKVCSIVEVAAGLTRYKVYQ
jgi:hypothetical protein